MKQGGRTRGHTGGIKRLQDVVASLLCPSTDGKVCESCSRSCHCRTWKAPRVMALSARVRQYDNRRPWALAFCMDLFLPFRNSDNENVSYVTL